jgi:hypothetical protein
VINAVTQPIARKTSRPRNPSIRSNTLATTIHRESLDTPQVGTPSLMVG